jgi:hypothetical protein
MSTTTLQSDIGSTATYHADNTHESQSRLKVLDESAALYHAMFIARTIRRVDTPDQKLGRCAHARILQPELFADLCPIMPAFENDSENVTKTGKRSTSKSTDYYQNRKAEFEKENAGRDVIDAWEFETIREIGNAVWSHEDARFILESDVENEVVHRWHDRINRRCMLDAPRPNLHIVADFKTMTGPPTTLNFARNAAKWRWWIQASWYRRAAIDLYGPGNWRFLFICVNKQPPYQVAIHELDDRSTHNYLSDQEWADHETERLVTDLICRRENGDWLDNFQRGVNKVPLPKWTRSRFYDLEDSDDGN